MSRYQVTIREARPIFFSPRKLSSDICGFFNYGACSLTRGRVCNLLVQVLQDLGTAVTLGSKSRRPWDQVCLIWDRVPFLSPHTTRREVLYPASTRRTFSIWTVSGRRKSDSFQRARLMAILKLEGFDKVTKNATTSLGIKPPQPYATEAVNAKYCTNTTFTMPLRSSCRRLKRRWHQRCCSLPDSFAANTNQSLHDQCTINGYPIWQAQFSSTQNERL
jgi:hypothetical protein